MFSAYSSNNFFLGRSIWFFCALLMAFFLSGCGGGGSSNGGSNNTSSIGSSNSNSSGNSGSTNGKLVFNENNADKVARHTIDSTALIFKLSLQLQEVLDALIISDKDYLEFDCYSSGQVIINIQSNSEILVDFNNCDNSQLEEHFDGRLKLYPETVFYNIANEVHFSGVVEIADPISLGGTAYSSIKGSFHIAQQATWHGDTLLINNDASDPIVLVNTNGNITINNLAANMEYDLDGGLHGWPRASFFSEFDIGIYSTELGGAFTCDTVKQFGVGLWHPADFEIYCSGNVAQSLLLDDSEQEVTVSLLNPSTKKYQAVRNTFWGYFRPLYSKYHPGFPEPKLEMAGLSAVEYKTPIKDAVYSISMNRLYVAVPSNANEYGNHLIEFDIGAGKVTRSLALKGEASEVAISSDGSVLYLGYSDFSEVQRVELNTLSFTTTLELGQMFNEPLRAREIAVSPESNDVVAVATTRTSGYASKLKFFRAGVEQVFTGGGWSSEPDRLAFNASGNLLFTYTDNSSAYDVHVYEIEPTGPHFFMKWDNYVSGPSDLYVHGDLLYTGMGSVMNPETGELIGRNTNQNGFDYESYRKLAPLVTPDQNYTYVYAKYLEVFDRQRFTYQGAFDPALDGNFLRLFNIGNDKFAFITDTGIKLFKHADVPTGHDWQCKFVDMLDLRVEINLESASCLLNDAVLSTTHKKIYASIPGGAGINGNTIAVINSESLNVEQYIDVGSNPSELEISHDQQFLYVAYTGTNKYSVVNLSTLKIEQDVTLGSAQFYGPLFVGDLEPFPTDENSVLISLARRNYTTDYMGMAVYTRGIKAANESGEAPAPISNRIRFIDNNHALGYNTDDSRFELTDWYVDNSGVISVDEYEDRITGFATELAYLDGRLYSSLGYVVDTKTKELVGKMEGLATDNFSRHQFAIDEQKKLIYLYASTLSDGNDPVLKVYSIETFKEVASVKMPSFSVLLGEPKALLNLEDDRLLVVLENFMYSINKKDLIPNQI